MIMNLRHKGKALSHTSEGWSISFENLDRAVDLAIQDLDQNIGAKPVLTITMTRNLRSIVYLLAALKSERSIAVFSADWTADETTKRRELLGRSISLDQSEWSALQTRPPEPRSRLHANTRLILFTSGSTGTPKAVELSNENIEANNVAVIESLHFERVREQHLFLDLSYSFGLLGQLLPALHLGITTHLHSMIMDLRSLAMDKSLAGMISGVPGQLRLLADFADGSIEKVTDIVSAGSYLPIDVRNRLRLKFPKARITSNYGQTEASPRILSIGSEENEFWQGAVGRTVRSLSYRISRNGELEVQGPQVMLGYLDDPAATQAKVVDGYLRTGDLASADAKGIISIHGRNDDQIKIAGERMNPIEIESTICEILKISECLVFAHTANLPSGSSIEPVLALVLLESERLPPPPEVRKLLMARLSKQKIPRLIFQTNSLPTTANGKRRRRDLDPATLDWKKI